jgi:multidrug efflux system membrane fusion protein
MDDPTKATAFNPGIAGAPPRVETRTGRVWPWLLALLLLLVILGGAWFWLRGASRPARTATDSAAVGVATIDRGDIRVILNELGTVASLDTVTVQTQISGQLLAVGFREGQIVHKGDFLLQIDDRPYQAQLRKDQGQLAHDEGLLAQSKADLARYLTLEKQNSIAPQQAEDQRYLVQQYEGTVSADQGAIATDQLDISYCRIVSPVDGRVGLRQVDPGNYVTPAESNGLVVVTQLEPISVIFAIPQQQLAAVQARVAAGATLPVDVYNQDNSAEIELGQLATIDNQMDTTTGTVKLRAVFANAGDKLFPNQFVNAHMLVDTLKNAVRVPVAAVQQGQQGSFVWTLGTDDKVKAQTVTLGPVDGNFQQVLTGLEAGQRVVTDGTDRLSDGMQVTVPPPPAAVAAPGATKATTPAASPKTTGQGAAPRGGSPPK